MCKNHYRSIARLFLVAFIASLTLAPPASADLEGRGIYSIEWLVDNSDVVAVVQYSEEGNLDQPTIIRALKGKDKTLGLPLKYPNFDGNDFRSSSRNGLASLIFVRGSSEVLQEIGLARPIPEGYTPELKDIYYGVTQYGELLVTQSALLKAVEDRIQSGPGELLPARNERKDGEKFSVWRPHDFPLTTGEVDYWIFVSLTVERRDHYIEMLETGDATERIFAIDALMDFDDEKALQAIRNATQCSDVAPSYVAHRGYGALKTLTTEDVRARATKALETGH